MKDNYLPYAVIAIDVDYESPTIDYFATLEEAEAFVESEYEGVEAEQYVDGETHNHVIHIVKVIRKVTL